MTAPALASVDELVAAVLAGSVGPDPSTFAVTSAFWLHHTTRLPGADVTYRNYYVLLRVGEVFGACSFEAGELDPSYCADTSGRTLADVLRSDDPLPVRIAALDAYLASVEPHHAVAATPRRSSFPPVRRTSAPGPVTPRSPDCWMLLRAPRSR